MVVTIGNVQSAISLGEADRMLKTNLRANTIDIAELKEILTDQGDNFRFLAQGNRADSAGFSIGHKEMPQAKSQVTGLVEARFSHSPVNQSFPAIASKGTQRRIVAGRFLSVQQPDLMGAGHSDEQQRLIGRQSPGRTQGRFCRRADEEATSLFTCSSNGAYSFRDQINSPDGVVIGIGHVERIVDEGHAVRAVEGRRGSGAIN